MMTSKVFIMILSWQMTSLPALRLNAHHSGSPSDGKTGPTLFLTASKADSHGKAFAKSMNPFEGDACSRLRTVSRNLQGETLSLEKSNKLQSMDTKTFESFQKINKREYDVVIAVLTNKDYSSTVTGQHFPFHNRHLPPNMIMIYVTNEDTLGRSSYDSIYDNTDSSTDSATMRELHAWRFLGRGCGGLKYKHLFQIDDDTAIMYKNFEHFIAAVNEYIVDPQRTSKIIGGKDWDPTEKYQFFGGNGILATRLAMWHLAELPAETWQKAWTDVRNKFDKSFGDGSLSKLASTWFPDHTVIPMKGGVFGLSDTIQDAMHDQDKKLQDQHLFWQRNSITLHKVSSAEDWNLVKSLEATWVPATKNFYSEAIKKYDV